MSFAISGILPSVERYGMLATNAGAAAMAWVGFLYVSLPDYEFCITDAIRARVWVVSRLIAGTIRYGERMRAVVDIGFSTAENN